MADNAAPALAVGAGLTVTNTGVLLDSHPLIAVYVSTIWPLAPLPPARFTKSPAPPLPPPPGIAPVIPALVYVLVGKVPPFPPM